MFCSNCGKEMEEGARFCSECGSDQGVQNPYKRPNPPLDPYDSDNIGWAIFGFVAPVAGLILYLMWYKTRPKSAKLAGIGALVDVIVTVVFVVVYFVALLVLAAVNNGNNSGLF